MADRSGYIGRAPGDSSVIVARKVYEPTGVQTDFTFTAGYTPGYCDAYINGVKLINSTDYTASDGSTVGLTSAAQSGDVVEIVAYKAFNLGMPVSDITGNLDVTGNISASSSITADGGFYGDGSNLSGIPGVGITQYIDANSLTVIGSPGVSTITRLGVTDAVVTGIITANGLSGNVVGAAATFTTGTFNGNVTIGGTLTYEDVTNVDAIGIVTARAGVAVTGGQLTVGAAYSVGHAGVVTAQNVTISAGTIDLKNSGSVSNIKFYCESSNAHYTAVQSAAHSAYGGNVTLTLPTTTDTLIGKTTTDTLTNKTLTSPTLTTPVFSGQATGELKVGSGITMAATSGVVTFADGSTTSNALKFGSDGDLVIYHDSSESYIHDNGTGGINLKGSYVKGLNGSNEVLFNAVADGAVELYYDNVKVFNTDANGIMVKGPEGGTANVYIYADEGDDNSDKFQLTASDGGPFIIGNRASGSVETNIECNGNGNVELYYDNSKKFETTDSGTITTGVCTATDFSGASGGAADFPNGLSAADEFNTTSNIDINADSMLRVGSSQNFQFKYTGSEGQIIQMDNSNPIRIKVRDGAETAALFNPTGSVDLYFDDSAKLYTTNEGVTVSGMMSTSAGLAVTGGMWEGAFYKVGKLSDNQTIGISTSNIFVFATTENTTSTPNIIWNDTYPLSSKMKVGDVVTVTVISVAAAGGYSANWTIDGNAISEQWNGGSAPSAGGSDGFDIYTHTIVRKGTGTGDSGWLMFSNVSNFT